MKLDNARKYPHVKFATFGSKGYLAADGTLQITELKNSLTVQIFWPFYTFKLQYYNDTIHLKISSFNQGQTHVPPFFI